MSSKSCI